MTPSILLPGTTGKLLCIRHCWPKSSLVLLLVTFLAPFITQGNPPPNHPHKTFEGRFPKSSRAVLLTPDDHRVIRNFAKVSPREGQSENNPAVSETDAETENTYIQPLLQPFESIKPLKNTTRKLLTILWDPHREASALPREAIEEVLYGTVSVKNYYLENSQGTFTIENAGIVGWYNADHEGDHYWDNPTLTDNRTDNDDPLYHQNKYNDGWLDGHVEKWAEAIRKADAEFDFNAYDGNNDGILSPDELGVLIIIPSLGPNGFVRPVSGQQYPNVIPMVVDGVTLGSVAEAYIGTPANLGLVAHELGHLLLGLGDMYFTFFMPSAAGAYSLMDQHVHHPHLDPFSKLKLGWLQPKLVRQSGTYTVPAVETTGTVWILMDPRRSTKEYFIVENRWRGTSYDQNTPADGLAVWHVVEDPAVYGSLPPPQGVTLNDWNQVASTDWARRAVRLIKPVVGPPFDDRLWNGADSTTGYDLLPDAAYPKASLRWADGTPSGFALRSIPVAGSSMSVTIEAPLIVNPFSHMVDLEVTQTVSPASDPIHPGDGVYFSVRVTNRGDAKATHIEVESFLSGCGATSLVEMVPDRGSIVDGIWKIESLSKDEVAYLTVVARGNTAGTVYHTAAARTVNQEDFYTENNVSQASIDVIGAGQEHISTDLRVSVSLTNERGTLDPVRPNEPVLLTLRLKNNGPHRATDITVAYRCTDPNHADGFIDKVWEVGEVGASCEKFIETTTYSSQPGIIRAEANGPDNNHYAFSEIAVVAEPLDSEGLMQRQNARTRTDAIEKALDKTLAGLRLHPSFPNPFSSSTTISFELAKESQVQLTIRNAHGLVVDHLVDKRLPAGDHHVLWQARHLSSGVYLVQLSTGNVSRVQRIVLIR